MRTAPGPREDGPLVETVGTACSSPPTPGMPTAPGRFEYGRSSATVASPPRAPGGQNPPGPRVNDTVYTCNRLQPYMLEVWEWVVKRRIFDPCPNSQDGLGSCLSFL